MWYPATITVAAAAEPVTVAEAKRQCIVSHDDDNEYFADLIKTARNHVEEYCGVRFATQTVTLKCDRWSDFDYLPEGPIQSVTSVTYIDTAGAEATLSTDVYELRTDGIVASIAKKYGQVWPSTQIGSRIVVTAVVGHEAAPPAVKHAMLAWIDQAYNNRGIAVDENTALFDALLSNHRRFA